MERSKPIITNARQFTFDAGHRIPGHEGKCRFLHGHTYRLIAYAQAPRLDHIGRVIDFSVIKAKLGTWLDVNWDHKLVLWIKDSIVADLPTDQPVYVLPERPTAENMAYYLLTEVCPMAFEGTGVRIVKIELWETPNCKAEVSLNDQDS